MTLNTRPLTSSGKRIQRAQQESPYPNLSKNQRGITDSDTAVVDDYDVVTSSSSPRRARAEVGGARGAAARLARLGAPQVRRARLLGGAGEARPLAALAHALGTVARGASAYAPG